MTRASTPGSLSTSTESVWLSTVSFLAMNDLVMKMSRRTREPAATTGSDQHLAFLGHRVLDALTGIPQDHLIVGTAGRDHGEAVFRRIDHAVEDHRLVDIDHFPDRIVEVTGPLAT